MMTYKLEPSLGKIASPVSLVFPDGSCQRYRDGKAVSEMVFGEKYDVASVRVVKDTAEVVLQKAVLLDGDVSFF